jgi:hypothetical protein
VVVAEAAVAFLAPPPADALKCGEASASVSLSRNKNSEKLIFPSKSKSTRIKSLWRAAGLSGDGDEDEVAIRVPPTAPPAAITVATAEEEEEDEEEEDSEDASNAATHGIAFKVGRSRYWNTVDSSLPPPPSLPLVAPPSELALSGSS